MMIKYLVMSIIIVAAAATTGTCDIAALHHWCHSDLQELILHPLTTLSPSAPQNGIHHLTVLTCIRHGTDVQMLQYKSERI